MNHFWDGRRWMPVNWDFSLAWWSHYCMWADDEFPGWTLREAWYTLEEAT